MSKAFASQADLDDKKITFEQLSAHCWAYTAEGDPNSGVIIGDKFIMVSDATATPAMAQDLIAAHPHRQRQADQVRAADPLPRGARAGRQRLRGRGRHRNHRQPGHLELIVERGAQDMQSEMERFPRLFRNADSVPGLTWPTLVIGDGKPGRARAAWRWTWAA